MRAGGQIAVFICRKTSVRQNDFRREKKENEGAGSKSGDAEEPPFQIWFTAVFPAGCGEQLFYYFCHNKTSRQNLK